MFLIIIFIFMLFQAVVENTRGVFVPSFKKVYILNDSDIGVLFMITSLFYMVGTFITARLIELIGRKRVLIFAQIITAICLLSLNISNSIYVFYISFIILNICSGVIAVSINTIVPKLKYKNKGALINIIHFVYGMGAGFTHKIGGELLLNLTFKEIYNIFSVILLIFVFLITFKKFPDEEESKKKEKIVFSKSDKTIIMIYSFIIGLYVSAEIQTSNWLITYIVKTFNYSENKASTFTFMFFILFAIGRLLGGFIAEKFGYIKTVIKSVLIAISLYALGLFLGEKGLYFIALSGMFFSIVFPTVILSVKIFFGDNLEKPTGIIMSVASFINMLSGLLIGVISEHFSIAIAVSFIPLFLFLALMLLSIILKKAKER